MKSKYAMPEPHVHSEVTKAWADGAIIEELILPTIYNNLTACEWMETESPDFCEEGVEFRVNPTCDYALAKIAELGGDEMVELYLHLLNGGELEIKDTNYIWKDSDCFILFRDNPFKEFLKNVEVKKVYKDE